MSVLAIIAALLLEQWRPVGEHQMLRGAFARAVRALEGSLGSRLWAQYSITACKYPVNRGLHGGLVNLKGIPA